jgi:hypothetical protein
MRIGLAFKAFFAALFQSAKADAIRNALSDTPKPTPTVVDKLPSPAKPKEVSTASKRSDALTLLAVLQREARFIDLIQEPLKNYSDAEVGAAAREVIDQTSKVLQRMFDITPLIETAEGDSIAKPADMPASRWKALSSVDQKTKITIVHPGWIARSSNLPVWTGSSQDASVLMPTEVE